jgi:hypothetical protein
MKRFTHKDLAAALFAAKRSFAANCGRNTGAC